MKIVNSRIEEVAVDAVNAYISDRTRRISGKLEKSDTGISVDGEIITYTGTDRRVNTFGGAIPVQVKGKLVNSISDSTAVFGKFDIATFRNFFLLEGVLIFLVEEIFNDGIVQDKQIFFKYLDTTELVEIISGLEQSRRTYKSITFEKLTQQFDFDQEVYSIHVNRRSMPSGLALYKMNGKNHYQLEDGIINNYEEVVNEITRQIRDSDFYDDNSEFLKQTSHQIEQLLPKDFVYDIESAISLSDSFLRNNKYELLQPDTRNTVLIYLAKLDNYRKDFEAARCKLAKVINLKDSFLSYYKREVFIANVKLLNQDEAIQQVDNIHWDRNYQEALYNYFYRIESDTVTLEELETKENTFKHNKDFLYLTGIGYSNKGFYLKAVEIFKQIPDHNNAKVLEVINYYQGFVDEILITKNSKYIKQLEEYFFELKGYLENLSERGLILENGNNILNSISSIIHPDEFIGRELGNSEESDIKIIQALIMTEDYKRIIQYFKETDHKNTYPFLFLFLFSLDKEGEFNSIIVEIENLLKKNPCISPEIQSLLTEFLVIALIKIGDIEKLEKTLDTTKPYLSFSIYHYSKIYLFKIDNDHQLTESDIVNITKMSKQLNNEVEARSLLDFVYKYEDLHFSKDMWIILRDTIPTLASEVICTKLLNSGNEEDLLNILEIVKWAELYQVNSDKLLTLELQTYYLLNQYKAILKRISEVKEPNDQILNLKLIAKIKLNNNTEIEELLDRGLKSKNSDFKLNAGLGMMSFGIDPARGSKIILREIIGTGFQDKEIGKNYVFQTLNSLREYNPEKELSKISGYRHYYYKLLNGKEILEIITLPVDWEYWDLDEYKIFRSDSSEYRMLLPRMVGQTIKIGKKTYTISRKSPLSSFVYNKMLPYYTGDIDSDRPLKSISVEGGDLSKITEFMEKDNEVKMNILAKMEEFGFTGFVNMISSDDELYYFISSLFANRNFKYNVGKIISFPENQNMQMSLSSLVFLQKYDLGWLLDSYNNIFIDSEIPIRIINTIRNESENGVDQKKLYLVENQPVLGELNEEQYQRQLDYLNNLLDLANKIPKKNEATFVHPNIQKIFRYDDSSLQSAIDNSNLFIVEDDLIQNHYRGMSALGLVHDYFLRIEPDIERYLDLLLKLHEENNIVSISDDKKLEIAKASKCDENIYSKFVEWTKKRIRSSYHLKTEVKKII